MLTMFSVNPARNGISDSTEIYTHVLSYRHAGRMAQSASMGKSKNELNQYI